MSNDVENEQNIKNTDVIALICFLYNVRSVCFFKKFLNISVFFDKHLKENSNQEDHVQKCFAWKDYGYHYYN